jgi:divalent metal cation (Fe/Co/Zn/Cd) transporter
VVIGLIGVALTDRLWLDALVAIGVALNIMWEGYRLIWRSVQDLTDEAVAPEVLADIHKKLAIFAHHTIRFDHLTTRRAGQRLFVDMHLHMPANWT